MPNEAQIAQAPAPTEGGAGTAVDAQKSQLNQMVMQMLSKATAPKMGMPAPQSRFSESSMTPQGMNMKFASSKSEDIGIAMQNMGSTIHNFVAEHKQNQVRDAMTDWQGFDNAIQKAQMVADASGTKPDSPEYQQKMNEALSAQPWVKSMLDPANQKNVKRLKNMYKALNVDLLDEKENVYGQALKQMHKVKSAEKKIQDVGQQKEMAQKRQQTMQARMAQLMSMAQAHPPDPKEQIEAAKVGVEAARAGIDKWEFKQGADDEGKPQWFAFDKTNPRAPALPIEIDGKMIKGVEKFNPKIGSTVQVGGFPYAVYGTNGKLLTPKDKEFYQDEMAMTHYMAANEAAARSEASKEKLAGIRAQTYINSREYGVVATEDIPALGVKAGDMRMMNPNIINKYSGAFAPVGGAVGAMQKEAVFKDIYKQADNFEDASNNLKHPITPQLRAQMILAARSSDPGQAFSTLLSTQTMATLPSDVQDYLIAHAVLIENAMAIRGIAGMGQGAQDLREAIVRALPGTAPVSKDMNKRQMGRFRGMVDRLHTGVPGVIKEDIHETGALPN